MARGVERAAEDNAVLLAKWAQRRGEARLAGRDGNARHARRVRESAAVHVDVMVECNPDVVQVAAAVGPRGCAADLLHRRHQEAEDHGHDADHDEQFDEREAAAAGCDDGHACVPHECDDGTLARGSRGRGEPGVKSSGRPADSRRWFLIQKHLDVTKDEDLSES